MGVGAWMAFVVRQTRAGEPLTDPLAAALTALAQDCDGTAADVARFLTMTEIFPAPLAATGPFRQAVTEAYLGVSQDPEATLGR